MCIRDSKKSKEQQVYSFGSMMFDTQKQILTIGDIQTKLTTKESELLSLLCAHANDILERNHALKQIWEEEDVYKRQTSFLSWKPVTDNKNSNLGYIRDPASGALIATTPFDIPAVSIIESFNPLIEAQSVLYNDVNMSVRLNKTRSLNLNIASNRVVETSDNDFIVSMGYKLSLIHI